MQKYFYKFNCEWDIGLEDCIFSSTESAWEYVAQVWEEFNLDDELNMNLEEAREDYYIDVQMVELVA